jgi:ectoine hydroxylase-related dioxygenase (phytanoyl-CoA dioxygenase family)
MDLAQLALDYQATGMAVARGVFSPLEIARLSQEIAAYSAEVAPSLGPGEVYYEDSPARPIKSMFRLHERRAYFQDLMGDARLLALVQAVFPNGGIIREGVLYFGKPARDGSVTPHHQDNAFLNWDPPLALIATIAIDRSTPANGALTVYRGSHALGLLPHRQSGVLGFSRCLVDPVDETRFPPIQICMSPGDVALHSVTAVHGSGANTTDLPRRQLAISYRSTLARRDEAAFAAYQQAVHALHATKQVSPATV